ncbi:F-box/WD repeat-containing protein 5 isoform X1 [Dermochelys coriacea]|uniref:F-box/WD repeat-containing protein 5 isoform X1 n=1 Tax=Dermochelys coriacea TaxID=27794 RepID=UPI001CA93BC6|nr:F-box/WD repeat-containing protein 5 isoform X1 [Dermochelys coriacea]XP_043354969.1 F-box/WD repeat-containing protein 5 isoform X1 [Dermochelys coriacea]XP_043354971.1 F-box/WD repeat-containing protein 5 isoform X1 [Dermochelys coriacea]XP_043354972.1 F-box/WD repeat-containing protein 5 isoform X1 [Dermochelys coriacea]XP_043354973.1 F-box/WD repeat-containing protein 5 isoform X1 [Dermochelys coriacea]
MDVGDSPCLPDCILYEIFLYLDHVDVLSVGLVCRQWHAVARDEFLWKELFYRYYRVSREVPRHPGLVFLTMFTAVSWYEDFQRLYDTIPCVEVQTLTEHNDQVLHLSFSHTGYLFASCSKDCTVKIWNNELAISLLHSSNMRLYNWSYTQFSQFNSDDSLLLVSGVFVGPRNSSSGEIAVISLENFTLLSRVRNKPYDVFGCWLNETNLISGNLHRIGHITSCSVLWLNNAFQGIESENVNVVKRLFKIQNLNASTIRTVMVADCSRYDAPDLLLDYKEQLAAATSPYQVFDLGSDSEEEEVKPKQKVMPEPVAQASLDGGSGTAEDGLQQFLDDILEGRVMPVLSERELETKVAELLARNRTKPPELNQLPTEASNKKKYLIFTTGCLTYSPHQIGIKQILPHQMTTAGPVLGEERRSDEFFDSLDHVIDIHGHIIGMGLSPDHRYLYVNSRSWPRDCVISDPMQPPPIAEEIDLHVFDLKTMKEVKRALRAHRAYTPNDECFFIFLDVSRDFVASGAEDHHGYIWDRHYNICLAKLQHDNVVNSVVFSPIEQELLLTASDDTTIKVWRSPRTVRIHQARNPKPRKLLFSWLMNQKS